jgi:hypothetical protein
VSIDASLEHAILIYVICISFQHHLGIFRKGLKMEVSEKKMVQIEKSNSVKTTLNNQYWDVFNVQ